MAKLLDFSAALSVFHALSSVIYVPLSTYFTGTLLVMHTSGVIRYKGYTAVLILLL